MARTDSYKSDGGELSTIIGPDATVEGNISLKRSLRVDGNLKGDINSGETVTIGTGGTVVGNIGAANMVMGGRVTGRLTVAGKTLLESTASLNGDLKTSRLVVEEGAVFNGQSDMGGAPPREGRKINLGEDK